MNKLSPLPFRPFLPLLSALASLLIACGGPEPTESDESSITRSGQQFNKQQAADINRNLGQATPTGDSNPVYRDDNGNCQLGSEDGGPMAAGAERLACRGECGALSDACAIDVNGVCELACNCDPLGQTCDDIERERQNEFGSPGSGEAQTQGL